MPGIVQIIFGITYMYVRSSILKLFTCYGCMPRNIGIVGLSILVSNVVTKKTDSKKDRQQTHNQLMVCRSLSTSSLGASGTSANEASTVSHRRTNQLGGGGRGSENGCAASGTMVRKERSASSSYVKATPKGVKLRAFSYGLPQVQEKEKAKENEKEKDKEKEKQKGSNAKQRVNNSLSASAALSPESATASANVSAAKNRKTTSVVHVEENGGRKSALKSVATTTISTNVDESLTSVWTREASTQYSPEHENESFCKTATSNCQSSSGVNNNTSTFGNGILASNEAEASEEELVLTNNRAYEYNQIAMYATPTHLRYSVPPLAVPMPSLPGDHHHNYQQRPILQQQLSYPLTAFTEFEHNDQVVPGSMQLLPGAGNALFTCTCPTYLSLASTAAADVASNANVTGCDFDFDSNQRIRSVSESIVEHSPNAGRETDENDDNEPVWQYAHALQCTCGLGPNYSLPSAAALLQTAPSAILPPPAAISQRSSDIFWTFIWVYS